MRLFLLSLAFMLVSGAVLGRETSSDEARRVALEWIGRNPALAGSASTVGEVTPVADGTGRLLYYRVALGTGGWLAVAGDTRLSPILAAVTEGGAAPLPEGHPLTALLAADVPARLAAADNASVTSPTARMATSAAATTSAERRWASLLGTPIARTRAAVTEAWEPAEVIAFPGPWRNDTLTHWNQSSWNNYGSWADGTVYDRYTPNHYVVGCVAVTGAALLQWFGVEAGPSGVSRVCKVNNQSRTLTTLGGAYDWASLPTRWQDPQPLSDAQQELLGRVAYDVGVLVEMAYAQNGSGATLSDLAVALREQFGLSGIYVTSPTPSEYEPLIYAQLRAGTPVAFSIRNSSGGHAVLAVGYGEDDADAAFTRIFMGWGGQGDAWYALPYIEDYTILNGIITQLGPSPTPRVPIYGRVVDATGAPCPFETVEIRLDGVPWETLQTGVFGDYATTVPADFEQCEVVCGTMSRTLTVGAEACASDDLLYASERRAYVAALPDRADFTLPNDGHLTLFTDAEAAQDEALRAGKALFVLCGTDGHADCEAVKRALRALDNSIRDQIVVYYCNNDDPFAAMDGANPQYGVFDPRTFSPTLGWDGNEALASAVGGDVGVFQSVVADACAAWEAVPPATGLTIDAPTYVATPITLSASVRFADGLTLPLAGDVSTWTLIEGSAATLAQDGTLTPTGAGTVRVRVTADCWGKTLSCEETVTVVSDEQVVRLEIVAPETVDLEKDAEPRFACMAVLANGAAFAISPEWACSFTDGDALIDAEGTLTFSPTNGFKTGTLTVTASALGQTATVSVKVHPYASWFTGLTAVSPQTVYPGMVVWATAFDLYANDLSGGEYSYHGTPSDYDKLEFMFYTRDSAFASSLRATDLRADALCLPIPKELAIEAPTDVTLLLACRRLGDPNDTYTYLNKSGVSLRILPVGETLGKERGAVPVGWLALHFPEVPEEDLPAHADEDSDGDGYANWEEYVLGTDPTDPSSTLRITSITPVSGAPAEVTWTREPGRVYTLLGTESLESPRWVPPTERSRFFKVVVEIAN